jgi:molybdopterin-containing oxidoreductase family iron-sulfur binding subunit
MVRRINAILENRGKTVRYFAKPERPSHVEAIRTLTERMQAGEVSTLVILGGNPAYDAPADANFATALGKVQTAVHLGLYRDETARACRWHLPAANWLESWGDVRSHDGTYSVVQPLVAPLYEGRSATELVAQLLGDASPNAEQLVRKTFAEIAGDRHSEKLWRETLHDGLLADSAFAPIEPEEGTGDSEHGTATQNPQPSTLDPQLEIVFLPDRSVYDGRFANNGWLQEMPDPITRLTWDNAAVVSPATAERLGVRDGMVVRLGFEGRELEIPALVLPGMAADTVAVSLGYGRTAAGHVGGLAADGVEPVGANAYLLRTSEAMHFAAGATLERTGRTVALATTQDHHAIDAVGLETREKRAGVLVQEASLDEFKHYQELSPEEREEVDVAGHHEHHLPLVSLWQEHEYPGYRWGMSIDLSKCIGCGACVVACQAENNVPIVGKERVLEGREMHWLRVDRYFRGDENDPQIAVEPVACQQCEMAPCEQVCPVAATVHSSEGLNDMVYNRCIGTRYCANNCPYKVRRFNYFAYHKDLEAPAAEVAKMKFNPEVTVRSRGVMEKCTYCVQRIQAAKIDAKNRRQAVTDGQIQTACQQACPAQAIRFGDLNDRQSEVFKAHESLRAYMMLAQLNTKPRTAYLTRIRNPNPELKVDTTVPDTGSVRDNAGTS